MSTGFCLHKTCDHDEDTQIEAGAYHFQKGNLSVLSANLAKRLDAQAMNMQERVMHKLAECLVAALLF